jgi:N-acetyl-anhydromuramyl-L-alanine amidase AmpD
MRGFAPFALNKNIPPGDNDPSIKPRVAILHVRDGIGPSLEDFFRNRSGGIESHFYIRFDGTVEQYRSIYFQADANLDANDFAVSIETEGLGPGRWTPAQLAAIKRLLIWLHGEAGIPLRKVQTWNGSGVGYHTLFGAPSHWTPVAKSCPGALRKAQFEGELVPWMRIAGQEPRPFTKEVKSARASITAALKQLDKVDGKRRPRVARMRDALRAALKKGPIK